MTRARRRRVDDARERGPRSLAGVTNAGTEGDLPVIDATVGARQRLRVRAPTEGTTLLVGARVPADRASDDTQLLGYDGIDGITAGHVFFGSSSQTATLQASGRVYAVSTESSLTALAERTVVLGGAGAVLGAKGDVRILSGVTPLKAEVATAGETPASPGHAKHTGVVDDIRTAATTTDATLGIIGAGLVLAGTLRKLELLTIVSFISKTAKLATGAVTLIEEASGRPLIGSSTGDAGGEVAIHGEDGVTVTTGTSLASSVSMFAPAGTWHATAGLTSQLTGGVCGSMMSLWSASAYSLAFTTLQSISSSTVTVVNKASCDSRKGVVTLRAPKVDVGDVAPVPPQLPTLAVGVEAILVVHAAAGPAGSTSMTLNAAKQGADLQAVTKLTLRCLPYTVEITPLGVKIGSALPAMSIVPAKLQLTSVPCSLTVAPSGVTVAGGASGLTVQPTGARLFGPLIVLG